MTIQICDWMRGKLLERRTRFISNQVIENTSFNEVLLIVKELYLLGLNTMVVRVDETHVRVWVDDKTFRQR